MATERWPDPEEMGEIHELYLRNIVLRVVAGLANRAADGEDEEPAWIYPS